MYQTMCENHIVTHAIDIKDDSRVKNCQKDKYVRMYQNTRIPDNLNISYHINVTLQKKWNFEKIGIDDKIS